MTVPPAAETHLEPEVQEYVRALIDAVAAQRLPELFQVKPVAPLYYLADRHGVTVIALRSSELTQPQLLALMKYRLAQYLAVSFVDPRMVYQNRMEHEPLSGVSPTDIHIIAGTLEGEILCYLAILSPETGPPRATLRDGDRPLFPVEKAHGWGIYNRLRVLPDLPVARIREMGRFVKTQNFHGPQDVIARAPAEVLIACTRLVTGALRPEVDAVVGDFEENVVKRNLDFFHVPLVVIHGTVVYADKTSYKYPMYRYRNHYPFAFLTSDLQPAVMRTQDIERALDLPGKEGLAALLGLRDQAAPLPSSLEPSDGMSALSRVSIAERNETMSLRRRLLDVGERLRGVDLFRSLSAGEAAALSTFMERREVVNGEVIVYQGESGDDLFIIESGSAEMSVTGRDGEALVFAVLGPGDYFGEIAVVTGIEQAANVTSTSAMVLQRLSREKYLHYLSHITEVEEQLSRSAARRAIDALRRRQTEK